MALTTSRIFHEYENAVSESPAIARTTPAHQMM
jgi:hypothetical protein